MAKIGENGAGVDCMDSGHVSQHDIINKLRTFCEKGAKGTQLAINYPDVSELWPLILAEKMGEATDYPCLNTIAPKLEVFDLMRKTSRPKQFWKHPYFSDYLLPFALAWVAAGLTLGRLFGMPGGWPVGLAVGGLYLLGTAALNTNRDLIWAPET